MSDSGSAGFSRRLHENVVEVMADAVIGTDPEYRVTLWNRAAERLYGYSAEEALGRPARELATFEGDTSRQRLEENLDQDGVAHVEFRARTKAGEWRDVELIATAVHDEGGDLVGYLGIHRDVTARRLAQETIDAYRKRIDTVFASITDAFYALDADFRFSYLNDRAVEVLGDLLGQDLQREDFLGNEVFAMFPGIVGTDTERNFRLARAEGRTIVYEYLYPPRASWFDIRVYPAGEGLAVYFADVNARKAAEALHQRQTRQQAAVAELGVRASRGGDAVGLMEEAVAVVSRTLEVELVAVAEQVGAGSQMLLRAGAGWRPGEVGVRRAAAGRDSLVGYVVMTTVPLVCEDVSLEDRCRPSDLLLSHGVTSAAVVPIMGRRSPFGAFGVFSRERRRFEDDEVNFLRAIAHVLHSAIERSQLAQRLHDVRDAERRRLARALHDETLQELGLALARAASPSPGDGDVDRELVAQLTSTGDQIRSAIYDLRVGGASDQPFGVQVSKLVDRHRPRLPRVECDVSPEVPDHPPRDVAMNVLGVLGEALTNVARHATASLVEVRVRCDAHVLAVSVRDDGRGFDDLRPPDLTGGHGIPGMRERAEVLGGELRVERPREGGTLILLEVPLAQRHPAERARVLLVDDHAAIREAVASAFAQDDEFIVAGQAGSLAEARSMLDGIDVAIVDLELPDGDGTDLISELRERDPAVPTLVLSAHADRSSVARAVQMGAAAVLGKTTHLHEVVSSVRRMRAGETLMPLDEVVELLRFAGRERERELDERRLIESLSPRELEVLELLAAGLDSASIARRLHISPRTQRNHVANILAKLEVHSQLQAVVFALRHGVVQVPREAAET